MARSFQVRSFHDIVRSLEIKHFVKEKRPNKCIAEWLCINALPTSFTVFQLTSSCLKVLKQIFPFPSKVQQLI